MVIQSPRFVKERIAPSTNSGPDEGWKLVKILYILREAGVESTVRLLRGREDNWIGADRGFEGSMKR